MTHASLFSGIGGAELAAQWMKWENVFHCEIQEFPRRVLEYHYPNSVSYDDITKTDFREWRGRIDVLTGGFPCQPFSLAGKRGGANDDRYLWPEMLRAIREIQPTWVVGENVAGLATMVQPSEAVKVGRTDHIFEPHDILRSEQPYTLTEILDSLEREGYSVQTFNIPACAVGAPHERQRLWIVAHANRHGDCARPGSEKRKDEEVRSGSGDAEHIEHGGVSSRPFADTDGIRSEASKTCRGTEGDGSHADAEQSERSATSERADGSLAVLQYASDSDCNRHGYGQNQQEPQSERKGASDAGSSVQWDDTHTNLDRLQEQILSGTLNIKGGARPKQAAPEHPDGARATWMGVELYDNTNGIRWDKEQYEHGIAEEERQEERRQVESCGAGCPQDWWRDFPTVSPVCIGNDGIPFDLSHLTISFGRWRQESIKAAGNAWVPQVAYEIFRAIEEVESYK